MVAVILVAFGVYFAWDMARSLKAGFSNPQWGRQHSRAEAPARFWGTILVELVLVLTAFGLAAYESSK